ncbi:MAG: hypothetical protein V8R80_09665 [Eubacterium sp.]
MCFIAHADLFYPVRSENGIYSGSLAGNGRDCRCVYPIVAGWFFRENLPAGISVGIFLLLVSFLSKGAVGSADGWMLCISGLLLDFQENLFLLMGACVLALLYAVALLALKRGKRQTEFPFFPFLLAAYLALLLLL